MINSTDINVKIAQPQDAEEVIQLLSQLKSESDSFTIDPKLGELPVEAQAREIMLINQTRSFLMVIARYKDKLVGIATVQELEESGFGEIGVAVLKDYWHQSVGTHLINFVINWGIHDSNLERLLLLVKKTNSNAVGLYKKCGFNNSKKRIINAKGMVQSTIEMQYRLKK